MHAHILVRHLILNAALSGTLPVTASKKQKTGKVKPFRERVEKALEKEEQKEKDKEVKENPPKKKEEE